MIVGLAGIVALTACGGSGDTGVDWTCEAGRICVIIGSGDLGFNGDGLPALETRVASPTSVRVDPSGRPVVIDYSNMRIRVLTDEGVIETLVGNGYHAYSEIGAAPLETPLENPVDAVWAPDGLLYILPQHEGRVIVVESDGTIGLCAGTGVLGDAGDGGDALEAQMGYGGGLAYAADGTLFVSDNTYSRIRRIGTDGLIDTVLGTGTMGTGEPGFGPEVAIRSPERLLVDDARGRLLVADTLNHRILTMDLTSLEVQVLAGNGDRGYAGDGGLATDARLDSPVGLEVTDGGTVLIADLENDVIRAVDPDGFIETVAGTGDVTDVSPVADPLDYDMRRPAGMAWTRDGDLLIAERSGHHILSWVGAADAL